MLLMPEILNLELRPDLSSNAGKVKVDPVIISSKEIVSYLSVSYFVGPGSNLKKLLLKAPRVIEDCIMQKFVYSIMDTYNNRVDKKIVRRSK